jgi:nucleoside-diphosphate-sugar epimerase
MRVFVAGGTGAIGRPLVGRLVAAGHEVTVLVRTEERAGALRAVGATPVVGDALDVDATMRAVGSARPDVIVNELTNLAKTANPFALKTGFARTERLRTEASQTLVAAAEQAGARRIIAQSIAFAYRPGPGTRTEDDPLYLDGPKELGALARAIDTLERATLGSPSVEGVVLRYGAFYGPGTYYAPEGPFGQMVAKRRMPMPGSGGGTFGFLHIEDAASVTVAALEGPTGTYNVVDDHPAPTSEWLPYLARLLGAKPPRRVPSGLFALGAGASSAYLLDRQPPVSNARICARYDWRPAYPDWHQGFSEVFA